MFRNSSSRPAFNSSSRNFPLSAVRSRLRSTDGVSQRSLLTAAIHPPVHSHFLQCRYSRCLEFNCISFVHHFLFNSCSALLCVLPISNTTWASCSTFVLVKHVLSQVRSFRTSAAVHSSFCWIVGFCCVLLAVAFHGLPTHRYKNCKSQASSPSRRLTHRVFIAPVGVNSRNSSVRSSSPTKTPRIHLMLNLAPSSEWFRSQHTSPNGTTSPVWSLPRIER